MLSKCCGFFLKGTFVPLLIIISTLTSNIIQYQMVNNLDNGLITGYLDNNLYTSAKLTMDSTVLIINSIFVFSFIIFNFLCFLTVSKDKENFFILSGLLSVLPGIISLSFGQIVNPEVPSKIYFYDNTNYYLIDNVIVNYLRDEDNVVRVISALPSFTGFILNNQEILPPGPWLMPFGFSIVASYNESLFSIYNKFKIAYNILLGFGVALIVISFSTAFYKYQKGKSIRPTEEELSSMIKKNSDTNLDEEKEINREKDRETTVVEVFTDISRVSDTSLTYRKPTEK
jgi:hypothetical protein